MLCEKKKSGFPVNGPCMCMYLRTYVCVCMYIRVYVCMGIYVCICMYVCVRLTDISECNCSAHLLLVSNHSHFFSVVLKPVTGKAETFLCFISIVSCCLFVFYLFDLSA